MLSTFASIILEEAGSTNTEAFKRAAAGEAGPLWIMARRQTQGRGRSGRQWTSEPGNLYASLRAGKPLQHPAKPRLLASG